MNKKSFNKRSRLLFKHFTRKNYALFNCLGREVLIGMLSVSTLSNAKANGICVKTELTGDSLQRKEVRLDEVIVPGSRAPLAALQSPVIVEVITREDIQRAEASSVNDILKLATGVDVRQRGGFGVQTDISINGGTFDQITILLNGTNISNPQTGHNASDFPVSVNDIERIEILEGASSRILGNAAFNGAINIVTKQSYPSASGSSTPQLSSYIELEGGSYGTLTAGAGTNVLAGNFSNYLSGGYTRSDGGTENSDFEKGRIFYKGGWNDNRQNRFRLDYQLGASTQSYGANTFYSAKYNNQYEKTEHLMASLGGTVNLGTDDRGIQLKPAIYYNHFNDHYQLIRHEEGAAKGENYHWLDILGASFNANINWLMGKSSIGADISKETIWSTAYGADQPEETWKEIKGTERRLSRKASRKNTNLFAEHNILLRHWTISAGLLYYINNLDEGKTAEKAAVTHHHTSTLSPGLDISYRPTQSWKICLSWNKAVRTPTYTDLYTSNVAQQGDPSLKPEENSMFKISALYKTNRAEFTVSSFYSHGRNMIDWVYETEESRRYHALNIGKLDNMGVSLNSKMQLHEDTKSAFPFQPMTVRLGYSYIHQSHKTDQPIYRSLYALEYLRHKLTVQLDQHIWNRLSLSWSVRWQQRMNGFHPYWKIDSKLQWKAENLTLYLKGDNLTAHRYYDIGAVKQPGLWIMAGGVFQLRLKR